MKFKLCIKQTYAQTFLTFFSACILTSISIMAFYCRLHPNPVIQRIAGQTLMLLLEVEACSDLVIEAMRKPLEEFHLKDPQGLGNSETDDQNMSESKIRNQSSEIGDAPPGLHKETEIIPFNEDEFERNFTVKILAHALEKGNSHVKAKTWVVLWNALLQGDSYKIKNGRLKCLSIFSVQCTAQIPCFWVAKTLVCIFQSSWWNHSLKSSTWR